MDDEVNDETYEFCPSCKSDMFLQDGIEPSYDKTHESISAPVLIPAMEEATFDMDVYIAKQEEKDAIHNRALDAYTSLHATQGEEAARSEYNKILNELS
jgi:hypothetical protein